MNLIILVVALLLLILGSLGIALVAFKESVGIGILILVFPPFGIIYAFSRWEKCRLPFIVSLLGHVVFIYQVIGDPIELHAGVSDIREETKQVAEAVNAYHAKHHQLPESAEALVKEGLLDEEVARDEWDSYYRVDSFSGRLTVWSYGEDRDRKPGDNVSFAYDLP